MAMAQTPTILSVVTLFEQVIKSTQTAADLLVEIHARSYGLRNSHDTIRHVTIRYDTIRYARYSTHGTHGRF